MKTTHQAGKGSKPRPVAGDTYRKNYDEIFRKKKLTDGEKFDRMMRLQDAYIGLSNNKLIT